MSADDPKRKSSALICCIAFRRRSGERVTRRRAVGAFVVLSRDESDGVLKRHQHLVLLLRCEVISPSAVEPNHPQTGAVVLCGVAYLWPRRSRPVIIVELDVGEFDGDVGHADSPVFLASLRGARQRLSLADAG